MTSSPFSPQWLLWWPQGVSHGLEHAKCYPQEQLRLLKLTENQIYTMFPLMQNMVGQPRHVVSDGIYVARCYSVSLNLLLLPGVAEIRIHHYGCDELHHIRVYRGQLCAS